MSLVGATGEFAAEILKGTPFAKMTGSGNDFVFFDGRDAAMSLLTSPDVIRAICNRNNGIGADGIVVLEPAAPWADARIHYYNRDGTPADLCGNATLCSTTMATELGLSSGGSIRLLTPTGEIRGRMLDGVPEIDLQPVTEVQPIIGIDPVADEQRVGFSIAGIPHVVVLCGDVNTVDLSIRGPLLRRHSALGAAGANVNWVSPLGDGRWRYRTFERGVEGETLACGTGAVATAILLAKWQLAASPVRLVTSSGRELTVTLAASGVPLGGWTPTLRGEGRVVFRGRIATLFG